MKCARCGYDNGDEALACGLCGEVMHRAHASAPADAPQRVSLLQRPYVCLAIGLAMFPLGKLLWVPNYVFNFLTTLVHECGHAACAWFVGRMSIPTVSLAGGGITHWALQQSWGLVILIWIGLGMLTYAARRSRVFLPFFGILTLIYPLLVFTKMSLILPIAGGILFELLGAGACFVTCLGIRLARPFERPLYAVWGWWMLLNRMAEACLILKSPSYAADQAIIDSGLAAGLPSDLTTLGWTANVPRHAILCAILVLGALMVPLSMWIARWLQGYYPIRME